MTTPWNRSALLLSLSLIATPAAFADDYAARADAALALTKPEATDSADVARAKCQRLAEQNQAKVLVIAFEGLASFSQASTVQAYRYHWELAHQLPATPPGGAVTGFVVNGTLVPLIRKFQGSMEFLAFPYSAQSDSAGSIPETCALEWMKAKGRHLVVLGHSFGGDAAVQLMSQLEERSVMVDLAATIDPVPKTPRPQSVIHVTRNARRWDNFYQRIMLPMGVSLPGATVNERVSAMHVNVPRQPEVVNAITSSLLPLTQR